ncbi:MAG: tRNA lysidine(34) synthetase TilS, partial [Desulfatiglandales bacterium]
NRDSRYLRNWIRLELIPVLKRVQPRIIHVLGRTAKTLSTEVDYYEEKGVEWLNSHGMTQGGEIRVPVPKMAEEHVALQAHIIMIMFLRVRGSLKGLNRAHIDQVIRFLRKPEGEKQITLPGGYELCVNPSLLVLRKRSPELREYPPMEIPGPGTYRLWDLPLSLEVSIFEGRPKYLEGGPDSAFLDLKKASFPLKVRTFLPGDWFYPLGMVGRKKLQDFFVDQKIPKYERGRIPLVLSGERIVWVGGFRIDHHFRVTEETESALFLLLKREGPI